MYNILNHSYFVSFGLKSLYGIISNVHVHVTDLLCDSSLLPGQGAVCLDGTPPAYYIHSGKYNCHYSYIKIISHAF